MSGDDNSMLYGLIPVGTLIIGWAIGQLVIELRFRREMRDKNDNQQP